MRRIGRGPRDDYTGQPSAMEGTQPRHKIIPVKGFQLAGLNTRNHRGRLLHGVLRPGVIGAKRGDIGECQGCRAL